MSSRAIPQTVKRQEQLFDWIAGSFGRPVRVGRKGVVTGNGWGVKMGEHRGKAGLSRESNSRGHLTSDAARHHLHPE